MYLIDIKKFPCVVTIINTKQVASNQDSWYPISEFDFPKQILVTRVDKVSTKICSLQWVDGIKARNIYTYTNLEIELSDNKELLATYGKYMIENAQSFLGHNMTVGSDPEIFAEGFRGELIPAFNFLPSKEKPLLGDHTRPNEKTYWDGFQAEFTTESQNCLSYHVDSIQRGLKTVLQKARTINPDAKLSCKTVFDIDPETLLTAKEEHVTFGCMPSKNAYGLKGLAIPPREVTFRPAGGHLHFGIGSREPAQMAEIVKGLDAILGVCCVSLFRSFDNPKRRQLYGLPGEYRTPAHGLEYRTLSNAWLVHPMITHMVFDLARKVIVFTEKGLMSEWQATEEETIQTIINCDVNKAVELMTRNKKIIIALLKAAYWQYSYDATRLEKAYSIWANGLETAIKDPSNITVNWNLDTVWCRHSDGKDKNFGYAYDSIAQGKKLA